VKLTQEQKRIKLAEAAGWRKEYIHSNGVDDDVWIHPTSGKCWLAEMSVLPDYFNDLNAVHELESKLTHQQHLTYRKKLWDIAITRGPDDVWDRHYISPTAAQRAEALGLTLNLWTP